MTGATADPLSRHYRSAGLLERIGAALQGLGKDLSRLTPEDLAPIDEFHSRGRAATGELAARLAPPPGARVLDLGSGLGGPSRHLAGAYGCRVTGIDITPDYVEAARGLAGWLGLAGQVDYLVADALDLPFEAESFDLVWTQHVSMNIADKPRLYRGIHRVLKPGGRLAFFDPVAGPDGGVHFPVPWARDQSTSHLATASCLRGLIEECGLAVESWRDVTEPARLWFAETARRVGERGLPPLGLALVLGPDFKTMLNNMAENLAENRLGLIEAILVKK